MSFLILCWCIRIVFYFCASKAGQNFSNMTMVTKVCFSAGRFVLVLWLALKPSLWIIHNDKKHYELLKNLLNNFFQNKCIGPLLGKAENLITHFQIRNEQQLPVIEQHHYPCNASNCLLHLPTPTWLLWLVQKSLHPGPKVYCSLGCYSAPYCIGGVTENLKHS